MGLVALPDEQRAPLAGRLRLEAAAVDQPGAERRPGRRRGAPRPGRGTTAPGSTSTSTRGSATSSSTARSATTGEPGHGVEHLAVLDRAPRRPLRRWRRRRRRTTRPPRTGRSKSTASGDRRGRRVAAGAQEAVRDRRRGRRAVPAVSRSAPAGPSPAITTRGAGPRGQSSASGTAGRRAAGPLRRHHGAGRAVPRAVPGVHLDVGAGVARLSHGLVLLAHRRSAPRTAAPRRTTSWSAYSSPSSSSTCSGRVAEDAGAHLVELLRR